LISKKDYERIIGKRIRYDVVLKSQTAAELIKKYKKGKLKILDIGSGHGLITFFLEKEWEYYGIDVDEERLRRSKKIKLKNVKFFLRDAENFNFKHKFDVILALDIIEHLGHPKKCIKLVSEHLDDDGIFIVSNPNKHGLWAFFFDSKNKTSKITTFIFNLNFVQNLLKKKKLMENWEDKYYKKGLHEHKHHWSPKEFAEMTKKYGLNLIEVLPRPVFSEGIGWLIKDYRRFQNLDSNLGRLFPQFATGWFLVFRKNHPYLA